MGKFNTKSIAVRTFTVLILIIIILITRAASEQSGTSSNIASKKIVKFTMETMINNDFPVNREDVFWRMTANMLVRKAAHFTEYLLIGFFLSMVFNFFTKKMWISIPGASIVGFILAYMDEYRQQFVEGRASTWFDVRLDTYGLLMGILIATSFFVIYNRIWKLKGEIRKLEEELGK